MWQSSLYKYTYCCLCEGSDDTIGSFWSWTEEEQSILCLQELLEQILDGWEETGMGERGWRRHQYEQALKQAAETSSEQHITDKYLMVDNRELEKTSVWTGIPPGCWTKQYQYEQAHHHASEQCACNMVVQGEILSK